MKHFVAFALAVAVLSNVAYAADPLDPEQFKVEITGSSWITDTSGSVQSSGTAIDFRHDLNFEQQTPTFFGSFVFKPGRKHRILVEGSPLSFSGSGVIQRAIVFEGQTFNVNEDLTSKSELTYVYGGYQYDFLSGPKGHLGVNVGAVYLDGSATVTSVQASTRASRSQKLGFPLVGLEGRMFPLPGHKWLDVDAGIRGMGLGDYGHFVEGSANLGVWLGPVGLRAGYRELQTTLQDIGGADIGGITLHLRGPIFSGTFRW